MKSRWCCRSILVALVVGRATAVQVQDPFDDSSQALEAGLDGTEQPSLGLASQQAEEYQQASIALGEEEGANETAKAKKKPLPDFSKTKDDQAAIDAAQASVLRLPSTPAGPSKSLAPDPVKEVIRVLRALGKRIQLRDAGAAKLYDHFGQYCSRGGRGLERSLSEAQVELPQLELEATKLQKKHAVLKADLEQHDADERNARLTIGAAQSIREREKTANRKKLNMYEIAINSIKDFISDKVTVTDKQMAKAKGDEELEEGDGTATPESMASFVQLESITREQYSERLSHVQNIIAALGGAASQIDHPDKWTSLLQAEPDDRARNQAKELMKLQLKKILAEHKRIYQAEEQAANSFRVMTEAKNKELLTLMTALQEKKVRDATFRSEVVLVKNMRDDAKIKLEETKGLIETLREWCGEQRNKHQRTRKIMADEVIAIQGAARFLLTGGKMDIWKPPSIAAPPGAELIQSFLQTGSSQRLRGAQQTSKRGEGDLEKVLGLVDNMIKVLENEQRDDDRKIKQCTGQKRASSGERNDLTTEVDGKKAYVASLAESMETLKNDIANEKLAMGMTDWIVTTATELRRDSHGAISKAVMQGAAGVDVLNKARVKLSNFLSWGGKILPGDSLIQGSSSAKSDNEGLGFLAEETEGQSDSGGVDGSVALRKIDEVVAAIKVEVAQLNKDEATDQKMYEALLKSAEQSRKKNGRTLTNLVGAQADMAAGTRAVQASQKQSMSQLKAANAVDSELSSECKGIVANYEDKKAARKDEIDALKAKKTNLRTALSEMMR
eukprot:TRINITY_DN48171_c0_g1_i1.p1 TRINITY_DN48171_c0_g1~~TRINITY_DN48171_c0_g1_i1.p1  ORF type:complete len:786 (-),score=224.24 TRINITY_DN48171_c0_g1_i1:141-2498(-)